MGLYITGYQALWENRVLCSNTRGDRRSFVVVNEHNILSILSQWLLFKTFHAIIIFNDWANILFYREKEKFCILGLFVSLCKRQPPDGSEEPDEHIRGTRSNGDTPDFVERGEKPQVDSNQNVQTTKMTPSTQEGVEIDTKNIPTIFRVIDHGYCSQTMTQQRPCVETAITDVWRISEVSSIRNHHTVGNIRRETVFRYFSA